MGNRFSFYYYIFLFEKKKYIGRRRSVETVDKACNCSVNRVGD
ncbi:hypothetical protein HMPREF1990_01076 [Porphyromonas gingivalis W4087]|nr:hypothetical protein HMPREF1990_01076 [Porphyromonas gingivalis W4087]